MEQSPFHSLPLSAPPPPPLPPTPFPFFTIPLKAPRLLFFEPLALAPEAEKGGRLVLHPPPPSLPPPPPLPASHAAGSSKPVRAQLSSAAAPPAAAPGTLDMKTNLEADTVVLPEAREPERACRLPDRDRNEPLRWTCRVFGLFWFGLVWFCSVTGG